MTLRHLFPCCHIIRALASFRLDKVTFFRVPFQGPKHRAVGIKEFRGTLRFVEASIDQEATLFPDVYEGHVFKHVFMQKGCYVEDLFLCWTELDNATAPEVVKCPRFFTWNLNQVVEYTQERSVSSQILWGIY